MRHEAGAAGQQDEEHVESRSGMAEHLNGEQRAADWPDDGVHRVPGRIDPRDFVREKFEEIKDARDGDDPGMAEDFEGMVVRRENDPVLIDGEAGDEDGQVKIDPGQTGQAERDAQKVESFHAEISDAARDCHLVFIVDGGGNSPRMILMARDGRFQAPEARRSLARSEA